MWTTVASAILAAVLLCEAVGSAYFASVTHHQIQPYLDTHTMVRDARIAQMVFVYLILSAVIASVSFAITIVSVCLPTEKKPASCCNGCCKLIQACLSIFIIAGGIITAKTSWGWKHLFDIGGDDHLALQSLGLAVMTTITLTLAAVFFLGLTCIFLVICVAKCESDKSESTDNPIHTDIEGQKGDADDSQKEDKPSV